MKLPIAADFDFAIEVKTSGLGGPIIAFESSARKPIRAVNSLYRHVNVKKG